MTFAVTATRTNPNGATAQIPTFYVNAASQAEADAKAADVAGPGSYVYAVEV
jgi:hypothetical protein